jgi:hypothetical protein
VNCTPKATTDKNQEQSQLFLCPFCQSGTVSGIYLFPLSLEELEKAVALKKASSSPETSNSVFGDKRKRDEDPVTQDDIAFSVYSRWRTGSRSMLADNDQHRTGRWTDTEMAYVDHLVMIFDEGKLPIAEGVKLNTLLCDLLLCKSSRLTKKMKNAKLSTRAFKAAPSGAVIVSQENCQILSALQETFLSGQSSETAQLELRFSVTRQWRAYFSNYCMQAGYLFLDAKDWISSIEELEGRASAAEERVRKIRRKCMSQALCSQNSNGMLNDTMKQSPPFGSSQVAEGPKMDYVASSLMPGCHQLDSPALTSTTAHLEQKQQSRRARTFSEDFDVVLRDLAGGPDAAAAKSHSTSAPRAAPPKTFLDALRLLMETPNSPYQHADIWVPSLSQNGGSGNVVQLLHAGYVTRRDQSEGSYSSQNDFGEYSKSFTFLPGQGLPGRVYATGQASWDFKLFSLDPSHFARASGANVYGIKTATGIPINTQGVGRMVVVLYSCNDLIQDSWLTNEFAAALAKYSPQPKWKLVVDTNENSNSFATPTDAKFQLRTKEKSLNQTLETTGIVSPVSTSTEPHRATSPYASSETKTDSIEQEIINLLGHEAANFHTMAITNLSNSSDPDHLFPQYMMIRLLLLREASRRSSEENDMIEILKSSYQSYSKSSTRSNPDLAKLLVRDWVCMKSPANPYSFSKNLTTAKEMPVVSLPTVSLVLPHEGGEQTILLQPASKSLFKPTFMSSMGPLDCPPLKLQRRVSTGSKIGS